MSEKDLVCSCNTIHSDQVDLAKSKLINEETSHELSDFFSLFSDPTRLKILHALSACELCVCDIAAVIGTSSSAVSHQLRVLRSARVIKSRKEGKMVFYTLDDDHIRKIITMGLEHIDE